MLVVEVPVQAAGRVQVNVYGDVPPLAVALHVKALPAVWPVPQLTAFANACAPTLAVAAPVAVIVFESRAVLLIE